MIHIYLAFCSTADEHQTVRALARFGLERSFGLKNVVFAKDERGKPYVKGSSVHISLSHSHRLCIVAASDEPVGIDIEKYPFVWDNEESQRVCRLARRYFSSDEANAVQNYPFCFYDLWTAKESYIKYTGEGFSRPLSSFSVMQMKGLRFTTLALDGFAACICSQNSPISEPCVVSNEELRHWLPANPPDTL